MKLREFFERWGWLLLLITAILLRWWGNGFGLPYIYTSDEAVTVNRAVRFGTLDFNPHWFNYGSLNMYFLFANYGVLYVFLRLAGIVADTGAYARLFISDPSSFYLLGRAWSGIWSALTVLFVYGLGRRWGGFFLGWGAALLLTVNVATVANAHSILNDPLMVFLLMWALWEIEGIRRTAGKRHFIMAGLAIGLASSTKYVPVLMFTALATAAIQYYWPRRRSGWRPCLRLAAWAVAMSAVGFIIGTPYALLDYPTFLSYMQEWMQRGTEGLQDPNYVPPVGWRVILLDYLPGAMGLIGAVLAAVGAVVALLRRKMEFLPAAVFTVFWGILIMSSKQIIDRYPLPLYPFLSLLAAYAVASLQEYLNARGVPRVARVAGVGLILGALLAPSLAVVEADVALTLPDTRTQMKNWIETHIRPGEKMLLDPFGPPLAQSREKLQELYDYAVAHGHAKADKFRLQLATLPPLTYEWYWTKQPFSVALPRDQEWSEATIPFAPIDRGIAYLREQGFRYVVISSHERDQFAPRGWLRTSYPDHAAFYDRIGIQGRRLAQFTASPGISRGPDLTLYDIGTPPEDADRQYTEERQ